MTTKQDFSEMEWLQIVSAIPNATAAVMMADYTDSMDEMSKEATEVSAGLQDNYPNNELVRSCIEWLDQDWNMAETRDNIGEMLAVLSKAVSVAERKATAEEVQGFKQFVYDACDKVSQAYAEREGVNVSEKEAQILSQIKAALAL